MKSFIVFALFVAAAVAAPLSSDGQAVVLRSDLDNIGVDGYSYGYETSNGIQQEEQGKLENVGTENEALSVRGQFSYPGDDGVIYSISYTADKDGFRAEGAHIPKA